jgi:glycosyltransferase involved in cell wall biosynthesis
VRVLWFGTYSTGGGYPRTAVLIEGLRAAGVEVAECHVPLFAGAAEKVAAVRRPARIAFRAALAWARLAVRFHRAGPRDAVVVGYTGHADVHLARALSVTWRRPVVLDAFLSPWDTAVNDRRLVPRDSLRARALFALEGSALRLSDLVLTDTAAHADFMAATFGVERSRFVPIPVGSLVRARARRRAPVAVGMGPGEGEERPEFTAFFCGSFVPLQGVPFLLDAAARAPDIRFVLAGDGPDGPAVERDVRARALPNVTLERRFLPREELEERLAAADAVLGVFGSTEKSLRVVPCKVYDGLAAGLPVVTGDGPGPRELLRDGESALLVDRGDPGSLVAALRRLRDEADLAPRLRAVARRLARERFSPEAIGLRLRAALARVARRPREVRS